MLLRNYDLAPGEAVDLLEFTAGDPDGRMPQIIAVATGDDAPKA